MPKPKPQSRSPITDPPARRAGESLEKRVYEEHFARWFALTGAASVLVGMTIAVWLWPVAWADPRWIVTVGAVFTCGWVMFEVRGSWNTVRRALLGAAGERAIGDVLDQLRRERGYHVVHDVPIRRGGHEVANVDHVLVGMAGVFVIETKARMKPRNSSAKVTFDGQRVLIDGRGMDRDPVVQVRANADAVRGMISEATGDHVDVRPVLIFPGWRTDEPRGTDFWLLNPKRLFVWIRTEERLAQRNGNALHEDVAARFAEVLSHK